MTKRKPRNPKKFNPGPCPKCGGKRRFYYCNDNWIHCLSNPKDLGEHFHINCTVCNFCEITEILPKRGRAK